jgi:maleate isomerase
VIEDRLTVGVVTPHTAPGPEVELPAITSGRVDAVVFRTGSPPAESCAAWRTVPSAHAELRASTELAAIDGAAAAFRDRTLGAVAHASTTSGYVIGYRDEQATVERLSQRFEVPAVASCTAAVAAMQKQRISRVQLVHPPWFDPQFDELGKAYFRGQGFNAVVTRAVGLPREPARVKPQHVVDWVEQHITDRAEAVFLAGNGFRAAGAIDELELRTGRLVLEANQALLWGILTATGSDWEVTGYGRLLRASTAPT